MKVTFNTEAFLDIIDTVSCARDKKSEVLSGIRMSASSRSGTVEFLATDESRWIEYTLSGARVGDNGTVVLTDKILSVIRNLPKSSEFVLTTNDKGQLKMTCGKNKSTANLMPYEGFTDCPECHPDYAITFDRKALHKAMSDASRLCDRSRNIAMPAYSLGVHMDFSEIEAGHVNIVSASNDSLFYAQVKCVADKQCRDHYAGISPVIIPHDIIGMIKLLQDTLKFSVVGSCAHFASESVAVAGTMIHGKFPDWRSGFDYKKFGESWSFEILDKESLEKAMSSVLAVSSDMNRQCIATLSESEINTYISTEHGDYDGSVTVKCLKSGPFTRVVFRPEIAMRFLGISVGLVSMNVFDPKSETPWITMRSDSGQFSFPQDMERG